MQPSEWWKPKIHIVGKHRQYGVEDAVGISALPIHPCHQFCFTHKQQKYAGHEVVASADVDRDPRAWWFGAQSCRWWVNQYSLNILVDIIDILSIFGLLGSKFLKFLGPVNPIDLLIFSRNVDYESSLQIRFLIFFFLFSLTWNLNQ